MSSISSTLYYAAAPADGTAPWSTVHSVETLDSDKHLMDYEKLRNYNLNGHEDILIRQIHKAHDVKLTLDKAGFRFHRHVSAEIARSAEGLNLEAYYAESEQLLRDLTDSSRVIVLDHVSLACHSNSYPVKITDFSS